MTLLGVGAEGYPAAPPPATHFETAIHDAGQHAASSFYTARVFSDRVPWPDRENRLTQALRRRREAGDPVIDLTETNPTRVGLVYPDAAIAQAMADPAAARYAPDPRGLVTAREAVSAWLRARGRDVKVEGL